MSKTLISLAVLSFVFIAVNALDAGDTITFAPGAPNTKGGVYDAFNEFALENGLELEYSLGEITEWVLIGEDFVAGERSSISRNDQVGTEVVILATTGNEEDYDWVIEEFWTPQDLARGGVINNN